MTPSTTGSTHAELPAHMVFRRKQSESLQQVVLMAVQWCFHLYHITIPCAQVLPHTHVTQTILYLVDASKIFNASTCITLQYHKSYCIHIKSNCPGISSRPT